MNNEKKQKGRVRRFFEQILGWSCLFLGIIGLFLPFLQGVVLILMGVLFLSASYPSLKIWIEKEFKKGETRHPRVRDFLKGVEKVYLKLVSVFEIR